MGQTRGSTEAWQCRCSRARSPLMSRTLCCCWIPSALTEDLAPPASLRERSVACDRCEALAPAPRRQEQLHRSVRLGCGDKRSRDVLDRGLPGALGHGAREHLYLACTVFSPPHV